MSEEQFTESPGTGSTSTAASLTAPTPTLETSRAAAPDAEASGLATDSPAASAEKRRPLLIGECPSQRGDQYRDFPLSGGPARVICTLAGIEHPGGAWFWTLIEHFEPTNIFYRHTPKWSAPNARVHAARILEAEPRVIVCLGRKPFTAIAEALDFTAARLRARGGRPRTESLWGDYYNWAAPWHIKTPIAGRQRDYAPWLVHVPHPSGLNRVLNDPEQRNLAGQTLREAIILAADPDPKTVPERMRRK